MNGRQRTADGEQLEAIQNEVIHNNCGKVGGKASGKGREKKSQTWGKVHNLDLSTTARSYPQSYPQRFPLTLQAGYPEFHRHY